MRCDSCGDYFQSEYALQTVCGECISLSVASSNQASASDRPPSVETNAMGVEFPANVAKDGEP